VGLLGRQISKIEIVTHCLRAITAVIRFICCEGARRRLWGEFKVAVIITIYSKRSNFIKLKASHCTRLTGFFSKDLHK
jgi:hypothetical protein